MFQGRPNCLLQWRLHSDVLGTSLERQFQKQYKAHYSCIIFNPTREMCCIKYLKVSRCLFLKFWRNIQRTSSKRHEMMSKGDVFGTYAGHQFWTSRTNAFKLHYFHFFSPDVWNIVIGFWRNVLKTSQSDVRWMTSSDRPHLGHKYKMHFFGNIISFSSRNVCIK